MLLLKKCAYIFHWSNNTYFYGSRKQLEEKRKINKLLKEFYEDEEKRNTPLNYTVVDDVFQVEIDGITITLNHNMIETILDEPNHVINNLKNKNVVDLVNTGLFTNYNFNTHVYSKKYKTLNIECFTEKDSLGFYRIHFKNNNYCFIVTKDNKLCSFYGVKYVEIDRKYIKDQLDITSNAAMKEFDCIMDYLME